MICYQCGCNLSEHDDRTFHTAFRNAVVHRFGTGKNEDQGSHTGNNANGIDYDRAFVPGNLCTGYHYVYSE